MKRFYFFLLIALPALLPSCPAQKLSGFARITVATSYRDNISYYCEMIFDEKNG